MAFIRVVEIRLSATASEKEPCGIALGDETGKRRLPILIGRAEFDAITRGLRKEEPERPQTHDLLINVFKAINLQIVSVYIHALQDSTFYACINYTIDGEEGEVDARPSDAIALAVRVGTDIWVSKTLMDEASVPVLENTDTIEPKEIGAEPVDRETALVNRMKQAVEAEDYQEAARLRDALQALRRGGD